MMKKIKGKIRGILNKVFLGITLASVMLVALPSGAYAQDKIIEGVNGRTFSINASAAVTNSDMTALGLDVVVSVPVGITLTLNGDKEFAGSGKIYAYGIMNESKMLVISVDKSDTNVFGKLYYSSSGSTTSGLPDPDNYNAEVEATLSRSVFGAIETKQNYLNIKDGEAATNSSTLSVTLKKFVPASGTGTYYTNIPMKIEIN